MVNEEQSVYTDDYDDGFNKFFEDIKKNPQYDSEVIKKAYDLATKYFEFVENNA